MIRSCTALLVCWLGVFSAETEAEIFATYNVRYDNTGDVKRGDEWVKRAPVVAGLIRFHGFDIVGTQEALPHQMADLKRLLPEYEMSGAGRDDGAEKGEFAGIFYKREKYRRLEEGRFWLSPTPDAAGVGWDAALPRLCAWARLEEAGGGRRFCFFTVHFDHQGKAARVESAKLVLAKVREISKGDAVVLTGDFNLNQESEGYRILTEGGYLSDAYQTAEIRYAPVGTANRFDINATTDSRIDHVFLTGNFRVKRYGILTDTYREEIVLPDAGEPEKPKGEVVFRPGVAKLPSDHFPVMAEVEIVK